MSSANETHRQNAKGVGKGWDYVWVSLNRFWRDGVLRRGAHWLLTLSLLLCVVSAFYSVLKGKPEDGFMFSARDKAALVTFVSSLPSSSDALSKFLMESLSQQLREDIAGTSGKNALGNDNLGTALVCEFNNILQGNCIHDSVRFAGITLGKPIYSLIGSPSLNESDRVRLNRLLLEAAYPGRIPIHLADLSNAESPKSGATIDETPTDASPTHSFSTLNLNRRSSILLLACIAAVCLFLGAVWGCWYKMPHPRRRFIDGIGSVIRSDDSFTSVLFSFVVIFLVVVVLMNRLDKSSWDAWARAMVENPGGLFAFITGSATLVGTYLAVHSILEMKHTITSYSQLISRLTYLIKQANAKGDEVGFLAYSPLTGAWNVDERSIACLKDAFASGKNRIRAVCLKKEHHYKLLMRFNGKETLRKGKVDVQMINKFQAECTDETFGILSGTLYHDSQDGVSYKKGNGFGVVPTELDWEQMPGYYIFVSSERAIVVVPVGIPRLHERESGTIATAKKGFALPINVETLGFETTDLHIIQKLRAEFDRYANQDDTCSSYVGPEAEAPAAPESTTTSGVPTM